MNFTWKACKLFFISLGLVIAASLCLVSPASAANLKLPGQASAFKISPDGQTIVYGAKMDGDTQYQLYSSPIDGLTAPVRLNHDLPDNNSTIGSFWISPDSSRVVYGINIYYQLHEVDSVPIVGPKSQSVLLTQTPEYSNPIGYVAISPASQRVLFINVNGLTSIPINGPEAQAVVLNATATNYLICSDSKYAVFSNADGLFSIPIAGPANASVILNTALKPNSFGNTSIYNYIISPDGKWVVYAADLLATGKQELVIVPINGPASNGTSLRSGNFDIRPIRFSPDSSHILILVYLENESGKNSAREFYSIPVANPTAAVIISDNEVQGKSLDVITVNQNGNSDADLFFTADSKTVIYSASNPYQRDTEVYSVPIDGPASATIQLTMPDWSGNGINMYTVAPDGSRVIYSMMPTSQLFSVPAGGSAGAANKIANNFYGYAQLNNHQVAYLASACNDCYNQYELYSIPIDGPVANGGKINDILGSGGTVYEDYAIAPVSGKLVYRAKLAQDGQDNLYVGLASVPSTDNPFPVIQSRSPNNSLTGGGAFTLDIFGDNFVPASVVRWNNSPRTTSYLSGSHLQANITAADIATSTTATITVFNPAPGGGESAAITYLITDEYPSQLITSISPVSAKAGGPGATLDVYGMNFVNGNSLIYFNGNPKATVFKSSTHLQTTLTPEDVTSYGSVFVQVEYPDVSISNEVNFPLVTTPPLITSIDPTAIIAGGPGFTLDVYGLYFLQGKSYVYWNGTSVPVGYVSNTHLQAFVPPINIVNAGSADITVFDEYPLDFTSNKLSITINSTTDNPFPIINNINPGTAATGSAGFTLDVTGVDFMSSGSIVRWNGSDLVTTTVDKTHLQAAVPAALLASAGTADVTVFNPAPRGGTSTPYPFNITNPAPQITSTDPAFAELGSADFILNIYGDNFLDNGDSVVHINGNSRNTTFISSSHLQVTILATDIPGLFSTIWGDVTNAAPGGGVAQFNLSVIDTGPWITSISPASVIAGGGDFDLDVVGQNFKNDDTSTITWNGSSRPTTFINDKHLQANISAADIASAGSFTVKITGSNSMLFTVNNPILALTSISPTTIKAGSAGFTLTLIGTGFVSGSSTVYWNDTACITTFISGGKLEAAIPAAWVAAPGTVAIKVKNTGTGEVSTSINLVITPAGFKAFLPTIKK